LIAALPSTDRRTPAAANTSAAKVFVPLSPALSPRFAGGEREQGLVAAAKLQPSGTRIGFGVVTATQFMEDFAEG